ncbi:right-handed parallel beta-helix repeat-containing protein [uncultured Fretibacterium sp.]|uniref:right-handed parallel beta-helix repeat-containing protein n=1 Tax=uncultured Fretibacterium sp. TaxID=1678694 RepID=UPI002629D00D|nr:right-handed parallel beta-helix repeat-containing protein [uncultured Fretibacterium sp.]
MYEKGRRSGLCVGVLLLSLLVFSASAEARTYHVTQNGGGDKGGGDWSNALDEGGFRNKLKESEADDVFWVARGIYRPSGEKDRNASFILKEGVKLYGGFKGDETSLESRRPEVDVTVLTGDLDGDDKRDGNGATPKAEDIVGENSYTVVRSSGCTAAAVLDGFTVCGGTGGEDKQNNPATMNYTGGMHNVESSPTITRCVFSGNTAGLRTGSGAGMCNDKGSNPVISDCTFSGNSMGDIVLCAGGMCNSYSSPTVTRCTFSGNSGYAGGMLNDGGNPVITHCTFSDNVAGPGRAHGGGMCNSSGKPVISHCSFSGNRTAIAYSSGGGMCNAEKSEAVVTYCTFSKNEAIKGYGGGMYNKGTSRPTIAYCTFSENDAGDGSGGGMYNDDRSTPTVSCCVFSGNKANGDNGKGGGMFNQGRSEPTVVNCTFSGNSAEEGEAPYGGLGGGVYNKENSKPAIVNCTFFGNRVSGKGGGGGIYNGERSSPSVINCILWNNGTEIVNKERVTLTLKNCVIQGWTEGGAGVTSADPKLGGLKDNGGPTQTHALPSGSIAVNAGTLEGLSANIRDLVSVDQRGYKRTDAKPDIGAYEFMQQPVPVPTKFAVQVSWNAGGSVKHKGAAVTSPFKTEVASGDGLTFDITANPGFVIGTLTDNGSDVKDAAGKSGYRYALDNVTAAHTLLVSFKTSASNPPESSDPKPNEPQKPDPEKPAPSPSPSPAPNQPLPPESSDVPPSATLPDIPISPERWVAEVVPESGKPGTLRFTLTTSIEAQQPITFFSSRMRDIVEGTLRTELSLGGQKASLALAVAESDAALDGSPRRYGLKLTGNVLEGNLSNTAITALQYSLEGDSKIHSVSLPEAGIPISKMQRNQSPQQNKSSSGGCEAGLGFSALIALSAFVIRRGR